MPERVLTQMALSGCKIIFATSFGYMDAVNNNVAKQFPKVMFEHATGYKRVPGTSRPTIPASMRGGR